MTILKIFYINNWFVSSFEKKVFYKQFPNNLFWIKGYIQRLNYIYIYVWKYLQIVSVKKVSSILCIDKKVSIYFKDTKRGFVSDVTCFTMEFL